MYNFIYKDGFCLNILNKNEIEEEFWYINKNLSEDKENNRTIQKIIDI